VQWDAGDTGLTNLILQANEISLLDGAAWSNLPPDLVIESNGIHTVTVTNSGVQQYFRLTQ
jgi:hypothetical protein